MSRPPRGRLRVYLGAAPGVGKTYAMLAEARRRLARGTDVVAGLVETHGRGPVAQLLSGIETVARATRTYRGASFTDMDLDALLARRPAVALVDELAHTNVPGSRNQKRWQDVEELIAAGIDVLSTVNIQHLESLNDVVEAVTGVPQRETVPDDVVRRADQVQLVDMTPEALRRRMAHGNIYAPEQVDAALGNYFRVGNLAALRELALLWMADKVDEQIEEYRAAHGISRRWETRERVVVALTGGPEGETVIRRAARIAGRATGGELLAVHVTRSDGLLSTDAGALQRQRDLVESLGGSYHEVVGPDVPDALLDFTRAENASQLVLGASRRSRLGILVGGRGVAAEVTGRSGQMDVHVVPHDFAGKGRRLPGLPAVLSRRRRLAGGLLAAAGLPALTAVLGQLRDSVGLGVDLLLYQALVLVVALVGGAYPAVAAAVAATLLADWYFAPPLHTFGISRPENVLAVAVFVVLAGAVSAVVGVAAQRTREAARARAQAQTLSTLAGSLVAGQDALPALLDRVRETFGLTSATLLERDTRGLARSRDTWTVVGCSGQQPCPNPDEADAKVSIRDDLQLALRGRVLPAADRSVLAAFAAQAAAALERRRLSEQATEAAGQAATDRTRSALLAAVSHDLRSPLASAKAAVDSLRSADVVWSSQDQAELLATAQESLDRLVRLVENLIDTSQLRAGALTVAVGTVGLDDLVVLVLDQLGPPAAAVRVDVPAAVAPVSADPELLRRVVANLVTNALQHSPADRPPLVTASAVGDRVELRVVDRGSGIPAADWERVFVPFQRFGDRDNTTGVGLGLALARGLAEAMDGTLVPEDTPGGGLTMVLALPAAADWTP